MPFESKFALISRWPSRFPTLSNLCSYQLWRNSVLLKGLNMQATLAILLGRAVYTAAEVATMYFGFNAFNQPVWSQQRLIDSKAVMRRLEGLQTTLLDLPIAV